MKLKKLSVAGYRSISGAEDILIDDVITVLIGANDHGKSNILEAINALNDENGFTEDDRNWDLQGEQFPHIEWHFDLDDKDESELATIQTLVKAPPPKVKPPSPPPATETTDTISDSPESDHPNPEPPVENEQVPEPDAEQTDNSAETESEKILDNFPITGDHTLVFYREGNGKPVRVGGVPIEITVDKEEEILALRPRVELFETPSSGNLIDHLTKDQLGQKEFEFVQGLFHLADIWDERSNIFNQTDITSRQLDDASKGLTEILNTNWNQGRQLEWRLSHEGSSIRIEIKDPAVSTRFTRPSQRSAGFKTFFVLTMQIHARTAISKSDRGYIFLFDEPGTYLHPLAQIDLQRSLERISERAQILYTTHSIFLINKNYPGRNRVVSKTKEGTKVDQKPFRKNWKAVREALGILLSNNFLIAEKSLLVEGPSDVIFIHDAIRRLKKSGDVDIDLNDLSIVDAGDKRNFAAMAKLMLSEGRGVVALVDGDASGASHKRALEKTCEAEIRSKDLQIIELPKDKSSEDLFVDVASLKEAASNLTKELVDSELRVLADGKDYVDELKKLQRRGGTTLGRSIEDMTRSWFDPPEKLSKLSTALIYDSLAKDKEFDLDEGALPVIEKIQELLNLRGEKSVDKRILEELEG